MVDMRKMMGFAKGFLAGSIIGGAACMMIQPPDTNKIKKAYKKTNRALKTVGYALEELVSGK
jgi:gas vesicle protein